MPAIITDQYRILNAETFVDSFVGIGTTGKNNYYTFLGHPKPGNISDDIGYGDIRWTTEPPNPIDNFNQENLKFFNISYNSSELQNKKFDVITCSHIYEHVDDPQDLMLSLIHI